MTEQENRKQASQQEKSEQKQGPYPIFNLLFGPNMNLILKTKDAVGGQPFDLLGEITDHCRRNGILCDFFQSNREGVLTDEVQRSIGRYDGLIICPGVLSYTGFAFAEAIRLSGLPTVEVRETPFVPTPPFLTSLTAPVCRTVLVRKGAEGFTEGLSLLCGWLGVKSEQNTRGKETVRDEENS